MRAGRHVAGLFTSLLCLLGGLWLLLGAWILGLVPAGGAWSGVAILNVATGAGVTLAAVTGLFLYGHTLARDLADADTAPAPRVGQLPPRREKTRRARSVADPVARTATAAPAPAMLRDAEDVLLPIASALLADVARQRGEPPKARGEEEAPR